MWYFTWILGVSFAVLLAVMNAMWGEHAESRSRLRDASDDEDRL